MPKQHKQRLLTDEQARRLAAKVTADGDPITPVDAEITLYEGLKSIQTKLRDQGYTVPDDLREFRAWMYRTLKE